MMGFRHLPCTSPSETQEGDGRGVYQPGHFPELKGMPVGTPGPRLSQRRAHLCVAPLWPETGGSRSPSNGQHPGNRAEAGPGCTWERGNRAPCG